MSIKVSPARSAAFDILWRVANEDAYASNLLASASHQHLSREDHALLQELVLGVLRWQSRLDFLIERYAHRKLNKLDAEAVISLRLGLYQLKFLSRVPPHAAINESVNMVKEHKKVSAASLVNAVLRSAQRDDQFNFDQASNDPPVKSSIITSHPAWLLNRWIARYGEAEAREMAMANNTAPRTAFRFNPRRQSEDRTRAWLAEHKIEIRDSALTPHAFVIENGSLSWRSAPVREGWIYLQDEASQLVPHLIADCGLRIADSQIHGAQLLPDEANAAANDVANKDASWKSENPNSEIRNPQCWDVCAAPGSKTTLLASLLKKGSLIVASDLYDHRLRTMKELNNKLGFDQIKLVQLDATLEAPSDTDSSWPESFDLVLLDAPCTGLGTLQRHPEIKWKLAEAKIGELAELQKRLLGNAARRVSEGGLLVYSVCSTEPEEGEQIIEWFRAEHPGFRDVTRERLMEMRIDPLPLLTASFGARTYTHRQGTESFFFCVLWKRQGKN
ncbi:MAG: hypothetical protein M3X11_10695 [Acidobacteriota bacterium]|nr:hypothetical protein [Acidobacteriota bacterium]